MVEKKRVTTNARTIEDAKKYIEQKFFNIKIAPSQQFASPYSISLSQFANEYIEFISNSYSAKYLKSVKLSFRKFNESLGDKPLKEISPRDVEHFITKTFSTAQHDAHLYHRTLKAAFSKAVAWEYLSKNPFKVVRPQKVVKKAPAFITLEELNDIVKNEKDKLFSDIYFFAFYSGMRIGEITNLRWNEIDFNKQIINVCNTEAFKTKSKADRAIPMHPQIKTILQSISKRESTNLVFTNANGIKLNEEHVSKRFKKALRLSKVRNEIRLHDLRHSFASILAINGVPIYTTKEYGKLKTLDTN